MPMEAMRKIFCPLRFGRGGGAANCWRGTNDVGMVGDAIER
jgi:hypothetical protein